jgi:hypothetical protein
MGMLDSFQGPYTGSSWAPSPRRLIQGPLAHRRVLFAVGVDLGTNRRDRPSLTPPESNRCPVGDRKHDHDEDRNNAHRNPEHYMVHNVASGVDHRRMARARLFNYAQENRPSLLSRSPQTITATKIATASTNRRVTHWGAPLEG